MKRVLIIIALSLFASFSFAQNIPAGMRMEISEFETDDNEYSVFSYKDEDGTFGYYLSLGRVYHLLELVRDDITDASFDHVDEVCLCMGTTIEEAFAFIDTLLALREKEPGTTVDFRCRMTNGAGHLTDYSTATCVVVKRFLQTKRLCFHFVSGRRTAEADIKKTELKNLRLNMKINNKLHPNH